MIHSVFIRDYTAADLGQLKIVHQWYLWHQDGVCGMELKLNACAGGIKGDVTHCLCEI